MKKILHFVLSFLMFSFGFSQELKPIAEKVRKVQSANKQFVKYNLFSIDTEASKKDSYKSVAEDVTVLKLNNSEIQKINSERPQALEIAFPYMDKEVTVSLVRNEIFTHDFVLSTDKGVTSYTPGAYYHGIIKGDNHSLVAVSIFENDVMGVISAKDSGNIIVGKVEGTHDYVSYNDENLKRSNPVTCVADELSENKVAKLPTSNPKELTAKKTDNCVRIYYEVGFGLYTQNSSNIVNTTNWVSAMHNNVATLYANDGITVALSEVYVWTTSDPFKGTASEILNQFRSTRTNFNGDVAQLLRNPATTSVAWVNSLCTTYNYSYCGINLSYANVPTYSWNIEVMAHEIGHNLGSPHTHACAWNGDNTAIDGCGPASGNDEDCNAALPGEGGTIMSYCHLVPGIGINFSLGFGEQPAALIRNTVNSKACLGTNCITSCAVNVSNLSLNSLTNNAATITIGDNIGTEWKYKLAKMDGTVVASGITSSKVLNFNNLDDGTYYSISVGTSCSGPDAYSISGLILTDADWCSGVAFTDPGGANGMYKNGQIVIKTFYPTSCDRLKLVFTEFSTEADYDFVDVFDGPSTNSPPFLFGSQLSGNKIPGPFTSTHPTGAITVRFIADAGVTDKGWIAHFELGVLDVEDVKTANSVKVSQTSAKGVFAVTSKSKVKGYSVVDTSGKVIMKTDRVNGNVQIDLSAYPKGVYVVTVTTETGTVTQKIIK